MADSTNADRPGWTPSEATIDGAFDQVFREAKGRIIVATFASLISRIQQVANAAQRYGRKMAIAGYSMDKNVKIARTLGILKVPDSLFVDVDRSNQIPDDQLVIMATGAQGEPSAVLARLANGQHRSLEVETGDTIVLSSHPIPGNEEMVFRTVNQLLRRGAKVIYDPILPVHVSGHGSQEEMRLMLNLVKPKYFMPVHGELRHLKAHAALAMDVGIPEENIFVVENGTVIEVSGKGIRKAERIPGGYVFVDGSGVGDIGRAVIRDRELLSRDGFLVVVVTSPRSGACWVSLRSSAKDSPISQLPNHMRQIRAVITDSMSVGRRNGRRREMLEENLSKVLYNETRRRPIVLGIIHEQ